MDLRRNAASVHVCVVCVSRSGGSTTWGAEGGESSCVSGRIACVAGGARAGGRDGRSGERGEQMKGRMLILTLQ